MSTFSSLFKQSQFVKLVDRRLVGSHMNQVVVTKNQLDASLGDYGLKYDVPDQLRGKSIYVKDIDTLYGFARYDENKVDINQWNQIFEQMNVRDNVDSIDVSKSLAMMTKSELQQLQQQLNTIDPEIKQKIVAEKDLKNKTKLLTEHLGINLGADSQKAKHITLVPKDASNLPRVQARVLNPLYGGYAVGIYGLVGFLPNSDPYFMIRPNFVANDRSKLHEMYICEVKISEQGKVNTTVALNPDALKVGSSSGAAGKAKAKAKKSVLDFDQILADLDQDASKLSVKPESSKKSAKVVIDSITQFLEDIESDQKIKTEKK
ncbi:hypothetical protein MP228_006841 [Amoeboaphelidium protococcarum]|nr:hypothetical protein MP228_006841 [Amoeboaphelidium protococcarum]